MTTEPSSDAVDRRLVVRTLLASLGIAAAGVLTARALVSVLMNIANPSYERAIFPTRLDLPAPATSTPAVTLALTLIGLAALLLPFLINRTLWRCCRTSGGGIARAAAAIFLSACILLVAGAATSIFGMADDFTPPSTQLFADVRRLQFILATLAGAALFLVASESATSAPATGLGVRGSGATGAAARGPGAAVSGTLSSGAAGSGAPSSSGTAADAGSKGGRTRRLLGLALLGAFAGGSAVMLATIVLQGWEQLFKALFTFLGESAEPSTLGWQRLELGLSLGLGLLGAGIGGILVALAPSPAGLGRRAAAILAAAIPVTALLGVTAWFLSYCEDEGGYAQPELAAAAQLEPPPAPRLLLLPLAAGPKAVPYRMEAKALGFAADQIVGATEANAARVHAYLEQLGGRWTLHTVHAWTAQASIWDTLLEPERASAAQVEAAEATGSMLMTMLLVARLPSMPSSASTEAALHRLLDPQRFRIGASAGLRAAPLAIALGDLARAQQLWDAAVAAGEAPDEGMVRPAAIPTRDRRVRGVVQLPAEAGRARVALYRQRGDSLPETVPLPIRLVAATNVDNEGNFLFADLPPAVYFVGVLLPESLGSDPARVQVEGSLGPADLTTAADSVIGPVVVTRY